MKPVASVVRVTNEAVEFADASVAVVANQTVQVHIPYHGNAAWLDVDVVDEQGRQLCNFGLNVWDAARSCGGLWRTTATGDETPGQGQTRLLRALQPGKYVVMVDNALGYEPTQWLPCEIVSGANRKTIVLRQASERQDWFGDYRQ